jgi:hypothetical protein
MELHPRTARVVAVAVPEGVPLLDCVRRALTHARDHTHAWSASHHGRHRAARGVPRRCTRTPHTLLPACCKHFTSWRARLTRAVRGATPAPTLLCLLVCASWACTRSEVTVVHFAPSGPPALPVATPAPRSPSRGPGALGAAVSTGRFPGYSGTPTSSLRAQMARVRRVGAKLPLCPAADAGACGQRGATRRWRRRRRPARCSPWSPTGWTACCWACGLSRPRCVGSRDMGVRLVHRIDAHTHTHTHTHTCRRRMPPPWRTCGRRWPGWRRCWCGAGVPG